MNQVFSAGKQTEPPEIRHSSRVYSSKVRGKHAERPYPCSRGRVSCICRLLPDSGLASSARLPATADLQADPEVFCAIPELCLHHYSYGPSEMINEPAELAKYCQCFNHGQNNVIGKPAPSVENPQLTSGIPVLPDTCPSKSSNMLGKQGCQELHIAVRPVCNHHCGRHSRPATSQSLWICSR